MLGIDSWFGKVSNLLVDFQTVQRVRDAQFTKLGLDCVGMQWGEGCKEPPSWPQLQIWLHNLRWAQLPPEAIDEAIASPWTRQQSWLVVNDSVCCNSLSGISNTPAALECLGSSGRHYAVVGVLLNRTGWEFFEKMFGLFFVRTR